MSEFSKFSALVGGRQQTVDLSSNTLIAQIVRVGGAGGAGSLLTKGILDNLIALQNGSDFSVATNSHTHDGRYYTIAQLSSATSSSGSDLIGDDNTYSFFTPAAATVKGALSGIDAALGAVSITPDFSDSVFRIHDNGDSSKKLAFEVSAISTSTVRTITMPDANVDLGNLTNSNISASAAIAYSKLNLTGSIVNADVSGSAAIAYSKLNLSASIVNADIAAAAAIAYSKLASLGGSTNSVLTQDSGGKIQASAILSGNLFLADGTVAATANLNFNSHKAINVTDPTSPQDAATKAYVDNLVAGLTWKNAARVASTANVSISSAPATIDGVTLAASDRILLKNQTAGAENGIYVFAAAASALTRATDYDSWAEVPGAALLVIEGSVNAGSKWVNTNVAGGTLGTTAITFSAFSVAGTVSGSGTSGYVAYWNGTSTLTAEQFLSAARGGLGADASGFTGLLKASSGVFSASALVNADVAAGAAIAYSKLALTGSIVNADVSGSAAIAYSKLALTGSIVNADISGSAAIAYSKLALTNSIVNADIASGAAIAYSKLALTNSIVNADIASAAAIAYSKLALTNSIAAADLTTGVADQKTITGGNGTALAVAQAPLVSRTFVAGEAFAADTSFAVRFALTGETAGRVYKADKDATSTNKYMVIGIAKSVAGVSAGGSIDVVLHGTATLGANDSAFASGNVGLELFAGTTGAFILGSSLASTTGEAAFCLGVLQSTSSIWVDFKQLRGIA